MTDELFWAFFDALTSSNASFLRAALIYGPDEGIRRTITAVL